MLNVNVKLKAMKSFSKHSPTTAVKYAASVSIKRNNAKTCMIIESVHLCAVGSGLAVF